MSWRDNQFDTMRILAAAAVLVSHSVPLTYGSDRTEVFVRMSHGQTTGGSIAVKIFFMMSGYLVTASYLRAGRPSRFIAYRVLRIVPALWVILPLMAFVAGPLLSNVPPHDYFTARQVYLFVLRNMFFRYTDNLPGMLAQNPYPGSIDGPLWTLRYEVACYACILILGLTAQLRRAPVFTLYVVALVAVLVWPDDVRSPLAAAFFAGSFLMLTGLPRHTWVALLCLAGWALSFSTTHYTVLASILAPYPVLMLATSDSVCLPKLARYGDVSYGMYIYAFPWQQVAALVLGNHATWCWNVAVSTPPTLLCAYCSWHLIELPALRLKDRFRKTLSGWQDAETGSPSLRTVKM